MVAEKLRQIKLLILDVDGVLTDGSITYHDDGSQTKVFNVKDGLGLRLAMKAGLEVCIVTGRLSEALSHRCKNLGIERLFAGVRDKEAVLDQLLDQTGLKAEECACVCDDLPELPLMRRVGLAVAVADARDEVLAQADLVTAAKGGGGAVRELCETILKAQGHWEPLLERLF